MKHQEIVVRIVQPSEHPHLPPHVPAHAPENARRNKLVRGIMNGLAIGGLALVGTIFAAAFFQFGFSLNDVLVIVGIPLAVGIVTSYAIL